MKLINVSNHPSTDWDGIQRQGWDAIIDIPFPKVDVNDTPDKIYYRALDVIRQIRKHYDTDTYIYVVGEYSLVTAITIMLLNLGTVRLAFPITERQPDKNQFVCKGWRLFTYDIYLTYSGEPDPLCDFDISLIDYAYYQK